MPTRKPAPATVGKLKRQFRNKWRSYGALVCLAFIIASAILHNLYLNGVGAALMLTVPCGIKAINTNNYLWAMRQTYFSIIALLNLLTL